MTIIPFTKQGYENLRRELDETLAKRPEAVKTLSRGRDMGDLSENGLYKAAKMELGDLDRQIRHLKTLVKLGKIFIPTHNNFVQIGHTIKVKTEDAEKIFKMVGEYEANPKEHKISHKSPIGHNLMGKRAGEEVLIRTPKGIVKYIILSIAS